MEKRTGNMENRIMKTKQIAVIGVMAAVLCILGPISIPLPFTAVPISFINFVIYLSVFILGCKYGTISLLIYLLLGMVGLPVFSGFTGGIGRLAGPTGGYLMGYIFTALITGKIIEKYKGNYIMYSVGMVLGLLVSYIIGTAWFAYQNNMDIMESILLCVVPFIPGDIIKIAMALAVGPTLRKHLVRADVLPVFHI